MKKHLILLLVVSGWLFVGTSYVFAQTVQKPTDYNLLAPIPLGGLNGGDTKTTDAATYIEGIFILVIGIAGALAVLSIIFGGIKYMSTDAFEGKSDAKNTIQNAIWGLLLAISAWLILYTINPKLVEFDLKIPVQEIKQPSAPVGGGAGIPMTDAEIAADAAVRQSLPVGVSAAGPCLSGQTTGCVNLNGIQPFVISGLKTLQTTCQCEVTITGGTEGGHSSHSAGDAVDIRADSAIKTAVAKNHILQACTVYAFNGAGYLWEPKGSLCGGQFPSSADHWHAQF